MCDAFSLRYLACARALKKTNLEAVNRNAKTAVVARGTDTCTASDSIWHLSSSGKGENIKIHSRENAPLLPAQIICRQRAGRMFVVACEMSCGGMRGARFE